MGVRRQASGVRRQASGVRRQASGVALCEREGILLRGARLRPDEARVACSQQHTTTTTYIGADDAPCRSECLGALGSHRPGAVGSHRLAACVGACGQNDTACVASCLARRAGAARQCTLPCLASCPAESRTLGGAGGGAGLSELRNALGIKFDTWFDAAHNDPHRAHVVRAETVLG